MKCLQCVTYDKDCLPPCCILLPCFFLFSTLLSIHCLPRQSTSLQPSSQHLLRVSWLPLSSLQSSHSCRSSPLPTVLRSQWLPLHPRITQSAEKKRKTDLFTIPSACPNNIQESEANPLRLWISQSEIFLTESLYSLGVGWCSCTICHLSEVSLTSTSSGFVLTDLNQQILTPAKRHLEYRTLFCQFNQQIQLKGSILS